MKPLNVINLQSSEPMPVSFDETKENVLIIDNRKEHKFTLPPMPADTIVIEIAQNKIWTSVGQ